MVPKVEPVMGGEKDHGGLSLGENIESVRVRQSIGE